MNITKKAGIFALAVAGGCALPAVPAEKNLQTVECQGTQAMGREDVKLTLIRQNNALYALKMNVVINNLGDKDVINGSCWTRI